jgi:hypothetical protein
LIVVVLNSRMGIAQTSYVAEKVRNM